MSDLHMWTYWRDKHGLECALEDYYSDLLKSDKELNRLYSSYKDYKKLINIHMEDLFQAEEDIE